MFPYLEPFGVPVIFYCCAGVAFLGLLVTLVFVPETKGVELTDLDNGKVIDGYVVASLRKKTE